eukprot:5007843-Amphidinium_carterae.1
MPLISSAPVKRLEWMVKWRTTISVPMPLLGSVPRKRAPVKLLLPSMNWTTAMPYAPRGSVPVKMLLRTLKCVTLPIAPAPSSGNVPANRFA